MSFRTWFENETPFAGIKVLMADPYGSMHEDVQALMPGATGMGRDANINDFFQWLNKEKVTLTPDSLNERGSVTFIYMSPEEQTEEEDFDFGGSFVMPAIDKMRRTPLHFGYFPSTHGNIADSFRTSRDEVSQYALLGRVSSLGGGASITAHFSTYCKANQLNYSPVNKRFVCFWNENQFPKLKKECCDSLLEKKLVANDDIVLFGDQSQYVSGQPISPLAVDDEKKNLLQQLHLMPSAEKKRALNTLGYSNRQSPTWTSALQKSNLQVPGQKWWAPQSENFS